MATNNEPQPDRLRDLQSVAKFAEAGPFTEGQIRWWIFNANTNGLDKARAIVRVGRRIYIDRRRFQVWVDSQNQC